MHSCLLVSGLPRSLPPLPRLLAPPCLPCVKGRQRAAPHSFPPTIAPLQTLHMDVWGPARVTRQGGERYFLLDLPVMRLHSDRGERRIGLVMEVAHTSIVHVATPHSLWPFAVGYATEQLNLWPRVFHPETSPTLRWTGEVVCLLLPSSHPPQFPHAPPASLPGTRPPPPVAPLPPQGPAPSSVSQANPPPLVEPLEVSSDTSSLAEGGDPTATDTVAPRRSARLAAPPGFPPRPSSPPLQP
ncbi:unnamed protein product, partial [Closterium sp. NIES-54]